MNAVRLIAIFAENKPGQMARVTKVLADAGVNLRWVTIATTEGFGVIKLLADQTELAYQQLRQHGFTLSLVEVLAIEVEDRPGGLHAVTDCLASNGVNMDNASGFVANGRAVLLIEVHNAAQARQALAGQHLRVLAPEEVMAL